MRRVRLFAAATVVIGVIAAGGAAMAGYGAVAYDEQARKQGAAWDEDTQQRANETALKACGSEACKVRFPVPPKKCGALASPDAGSAWGGSVRESLDAAKFAAMKNCQKHAKTKCTIREGKCNR